MYFNCNIISANIQYCIRPIFTLCQCDPNLNITLGHRAPSCAVWCSIRTLSKTLLYMHSLSMYVYIAFAYTLRSQTHIYSIQPVSVTLTHYYQQVVLSWKYARWTCPLPAVSPLQYSIAHQPSNDKDSITVRNICPVMDMPTGNIRNRKPKGL